MAAVQTTKVSHAEPVSPLRETLGLLRKVDRQTQLVGYLNAFLLYEAAAVLTMPFPFFVRIVSRPSD
jgi:hypothetical protein